MHRLSVKVMSWSVGAFAAVTFVLCVLYGLVESALYGVYAGLVFTPIYNFFVGRVDA